MFLRPVEVLRRIEGLPRGRLGLPLGELCRHQCRASHAHRRSLRIVITHGIFRLRPEAVEFRLFPHHLSLPVAGDTDDERHRQDLTGHEGPPHGRPAEAEEEGGACYCTCSQVSICLMLQLTASFNLTRLGSASFSCTR